MKPKSVIITIIVLLIIVVTSYFIFFRPATSPTSQNTDIVSQNTPPITQNNTPVPTPTPTSPALVQGQTYGFILKQVGNLSGKVDGSLTYKDGTLTVGVRAQNLPEPAAGKFYEAWLMYGTTAKSLAKMVHPTDPAMKNDFVMGYQSKEDLQNYNKVIVSLESSVGSTISTPLFAAPVQQNP